MGNDQLSFDQNQIIKYLIDNLIGTKARLISLECAFYAYIELRDPELTDKFRNAVHLQEKKQILKELDDLSLLDQGLSDALRSELDDLDP